MKLIGIYSYITLIEYKDPLSNNTMYVYTHTYVYQCNKP